MKLWPHIVLSAEHYSGGWGVRVWEVRGVGRRLGGWEREGVGEGRGGGGEVRTPLALLYSIQPLENHSNVLCMDDMPIWGGG